MTKELVAQPECEYAPPMYGNCPNKEHPVPGRTYTVRIHCQHFDDKVDDPEEAGRGFVADVSIHTNVNGVEVMQAAVRRLWEKIIACNEQVDTPESDGIMVPCWDFCTGEAVAVCVEDDEDFLMELITSLKIIKAVEEPRGGIYESPPYSKVSIYAREKEPVESKVLSDLNSIELTEDK